MIGFEFKNQDNKKLHVITFMMLKASWYCKSFQLQCLIATLLPFIVNEGNLMVHTEIIGKSFERMTKIKIVRYGEI